MTLRAYLFSRFSINFFILLGIFVVIVQAIDLFNHSNHILTADGATWRSLYTYAALRAPHLATKFTPFAVLMATIFSLADLSRHSEITIMRISGLSVFSILMPIWAACMVISIIHFGFYETVSVRTTKQLDFWWANDFEIPMEKAPDGKTEFWILLNETAVKVGRMERDKSSLTLENVSIYPRGKSQINMSIIHAGKATLRAGAWTLYEVTKTNTLSHQIENYNTMPWPINLTSELIFARAIEPRHTGFFNLRRELNFWHGQNNRDNAELRTAFYSRLAGPGANMLMPLLGLIAGFGLHRSGFAVLRMIIGMALGFAFFVAQFFMLAMGQFGVAPPIMAAFFPLIIFAIFGLWLIMQVER